MPCFINVFRTFKMGFEYRIEYELNIHGKQKYINYYTLDFNFSNSSFSLPSSRANIS